MFPEKRIELAALRFVGERQVFHAYATWEGWAYDHAGWNPEPELLAVNEAFEAHPLERITVTTSLAQFCAEHFSRMPEQYWRDPLPRARQYVGHHIPPWV